MHAVSALEGDRPVSRPAPGDFRSVDGLLLVLDVAGQPVAVQRNRVRATWQLPTIRPLMEPLVPELVARGLLGASV